jgi:hypothetical protein
MEPWRSDAAGDRERPVALAGLPARRDGRALKRWRYVGAFGPDAMLCVGLAHVGGIPQGWWAVWDRAAGELHERTIFLRPRAAVRLGPGLVTVRDRGGVQIDLVVEEMPGVETVCPHGGGWIWTRKQAGVPVRGRVRLPGGRELAIDARGVVDDTAGYHARRTAWRWAAGVGVTADGRAAGWNLVAGVNDPPQHSERSVWIDGVAREAAPCTFSDDLSGVRTADGGDLAFRAEATRERHDELLLARSDYVQPFGTFAGTLPGGTALAEGYGVMEDHRARW